MKHDHIETREVDLMRHREEYHTYYEVGQLSLSWTECINGEWKAFDGIDGNVYDGRDRESGAPFSREEAETKAQQLAMYYWDMLSPEE